MLHGANRETLAGNMDVFHLIVKSRMLRKSIVFFGVDMRLAQAYRQNR